MDPSEERNLELWEIASPQGPGVFKTGTVLWYEATAQYKHPKESDWIRMKRKTGQVQANSTRHVYVTKGEVRVLN